MKKLLSFSVAILLILGANIGCSSVKNDFKAQKLQEQVRLLKRAFDIRSDTLGSIYLSEWESKALPKGADGWFAIPKVDRVAPTYGQALEKALVFATHNARYMDWTSDRDFIRPDVTEQIYRRLSKEQPGDFIIIPARIKGYRGKSPGELRSCVENNEFGVDAFTLACIIIANPEIFRSEKENQETVIINCPGDKVFRYHSPYFIFMSYNGNTDFGIHTPQYECAYQTSATLFMSGLTWDDLESK